MKTLVYLSWTDSSLAGAQIVTCPLQDAASKGATLVVLPEIWNSAYQTTEFPKNAEDIDGGLSKCADFMSKAAKQHGITLVGGSIPELSDGKTYNTCLVYDRAGKLLAKHRKVIFFAAKSKEKIDSL